VTNVETLRQEILSSTKNDLEFINSARIGTDDYDFDTVKVIKEGGQAVVLEIKSKIDGKTYAAKKLQYRIGGSQNFDRKIISAAEREVSCLRALNHPMIMGIVDLVKDQENYPWIIMEKCNQSLGNIIKEC
jgi:serine/threonine protein kinase